MLIVIKATAVACLFTALFALKFGYWQRPKLLAAYFGFFFAIKWVAQVYYLPPDAFGVGMTVLCFVLTALIIGATYGVHRYEKSIGDR